jgi:hypothetical protein
MYEALRMRLAHAPIQTVVEPREPRMVKDRNTRPRPLTADALLLDDVWKVMEDVFLAEDGGA